MFLNKKIAIIGASYLQLPLVLKAKEMGLQTHCFAWEEGAVCKEHADYFYPISIVDKESILEQCRIIGIDAVTSIASDVAIPTVSFISEKLDLTGNSIESAEKCTNKFLMREEFKKCETVKSPKYLLVADVDKSDQVDLQYPLVVKPVDRSGSKGISVIEEKQKLRRAVHRALKVSFNQQAVVEEFITGSEVSVESISWNGEHHILAVTDKVTTGKPFFVETEHHQPSQHDRDVIHELNVAAKNILDLLDVKYGAAHSEFLITKNNEIYVVEVGARMGGDFIGSDLVKLSTGYDFLKGVIEVSLGHFNEPHFILDKHSGIHFLYKETGYLKEIIKNINHEFIVTSEITNEELCDIECSSDRSGYLIYQSDKKLSLNLLKSMYCENAS